MADKRIDSKALKYFLLVSFGGAWLIILTLDSIYPGSLVMSLISHSLAMLMPGIGCIVVRRYIQHRLVFESGWYRGPIGWSIGIIILCLVWWGTPSAIDVLWGGAKFNRVSVGMGIWIAVSAFVYLVPAFGEELGWRGFLLPELLPMGKYKAMITHGAIWGMWHWPIIIAPAINAAVTGTFSLDWVAILVVGLSAAVVASILLGSIFGYVYLRFGGLLLVTLMHAYYDYFRDTLTLVITPGKYDEKLSIIPFAIMVVLGIICLIMLRKTQTSSSDTELKQVTGVDLTNKSM